MDDNKLGKLPSSLYLATDSRITYLDGEGNVLCHKDHMRKIFISRVSILKFLLYVETIIIVLVL
jgi:hypothetical protein